MNLYLEKNNNKILHEKPSNYLSVFGDGEGIRID